MTATDRRKHRRLAIRLPVEFRVDRPGDATLLRGISRNVSSGGVSFETDAGGVEPGGRLTVDLIVPPADGHFPYAGRVRGTGEVLRVEPCAKSQTAPENGGSDDNRTPVNPVSNRVRICARFNESLTLQF